MTGWRKVVAITAVLGLLLVILKYVDYSKVFSKDNVLEREGGIDYEYDDAFVNHRHHVSPKSTDINEETSSRLPPVVQRKLKILNSAKEKNSHKDAPTAVVMSDQRKHNIPTRVERTKHHVIDFHNEPYLSLDTVNKVEKFVFFIGYQRSGHSIIGSFMDAHPHMIIAHEFMLFTRWKEMEEQYETDGIANPLKSKSTLFRHLYRDSYADAAHGWRSGQLRNKNYTLTIDTQWQGRYDRYIRIIGDKSGGATTTVYTSSPKKFEQYLNQLKKTVGIPIRVLHVVRNPFDMIATDALYSEGKRQRAETGVRQAVFVSNFKKKLGELKAAGKSDEFKSSRLHNQTLLESRTKSITRLANGNGRIIQLIGEENVLELHNSDLINDPIATLNKICVFLEIDCSHSYLKACADKVFKSVSNTRELVVWTSSTQEKVEALISQHSFLQRYSFVSD